MRHRDARLNHIIENWTFPTAGDRLALADATIDDIGKVAFQESDNTYWRLTAIDPTWVQIGGGGGGGVIEAAINHTGIVAPLNYFDLSEINQAFKNLRIEGYFRCYNTDFDDVISNLLIFFNGDYDDTGYRFSSIENGVHTKGVGAPIISKSSVFGAHKIIIELPMYSSINAFPTAFARSALQNVDGDLLLRDSAIRIGPTNTAAITAIRIQTSVQRLEFVGRIIFT